MIVTNPGMLRSLLRGLLDTLPAPVVDLVGREELEELAGILSHEPTPVAILSARDCAELLGLTGSAARATLSPRGASTAAALETLGRRYGQPVIADVGSAGPSAPAPAPRSFGDPVNAADAAAILGVSERRVRQLAREGRLGGRQDVTGGAWLFERSAVEQYARDREE